MHVQVGIIGAGPAGLLLARMLHLQGISCAIIESRSRAYAEGRVRAGLLEQGSVDLITETGMGERLHKEALVHDGIELIFNNERHRIDMHELTGRRVYIYGQQEAVKDMILQVRRELQISMFGAGAGSINALQNTPLLKISG